MEKCGTCRINRASNRCTNGTEKAVLDRICKAGRFPAGGKRPPCFDRPAKTSAGGPKNAERRKYSPYTANVGEDTRRIDKTSKDK